MNEITIRNPVGRPLIFQSVEELEVKINEYFAECDRDKRPYTLTGLAYSLDVDRKTLLNYSYREDFLPTISRAKAKCELYSAELLLKREGSTKGIEFNLSNNHEWRDQQNIDLTATAKQQQDFNNMTDAELEEQLVIEVIQKRPEILARLMEKNP